jgi:hypothetical protein
MHQTQLETRPLYGIGTVARLTGLKPDTLRVWERRYGLGASHKSRTGRRQYTQSDLEHLQLVAALVASGSRIGEIASNERKTLEMLVRSRKVGQRAPLPERKPRVVFVGKQLCDWLDDHQGCIAGTDARLARVAFADFALPERSGAEQPESAGDVDTLVVECPNLASGNVNRLAAVAEHFRPAKVIVTYQFGNERWLAELSSRGYSTTSFPPDPAYLAFEITRGAAERDANEGESNLGDLMQAKPRQFSDTELSAARQLKSALDCECPRHIADLITALANFEAYSSACSVDNWHDAAVHSCIYAYTGQARHLMEKALKAVLEERGEEFAKLVQRKRAEGVHHAA